MPRPLQYTRSRRMAMQVILWAAFGGSLGLAALVSQHRANPREIRLNERPIPLATLRVRVPIGWGISPAVSISGGLAVRATEPTRRSVRGMELPGRELVIYEEPVPSGDTQQYLARLLGNAEPDGKAPVFIAGYPGLIVADQSLDALGGQPIGWKLYAGAAFPWGSGVMVRLEGFGQATEADRKAIRELAEAITPLGRRE